MASRGGRWAEEGWVGRRGEVGGGGGWAEDGLRGALAAGWGHLLLEERNKVTFDRDECTSFMIGEEMVNQYKDFY